VTERQKLLESIANTTADYREGELSAPTPEHVDRWVSQFRAEVQVPLLRELDHVLKQTYFARATVSQFFGKQIAHKTLAGDQPCDFWRKAHFLDIQQNGHSQAAIRQLFGEALKTRCGLDIEQCGADGGDFVYLDDVLFTGGRIGADLSSWLAGAAPGEGTVHVLVIAAHRLGEWQCTQRLEKDAKAAGKRLKFKFWAALRVENRKKYRATSEVLWPAVIPDDAALKAYMAEEETFPFEPRAPGGKLEHPIFSSEDGRQLLERELLLAGMRIRSFSQKPSKALRPLGFSPFGLGFGSLIVTYRNCPNNVPLALWWGDPEAGAGHPFSKWYPLLPRKTYAQDIDFDVIDF
jgi:hypothetical protein